MQRPPHLEFGPPPTPGTVRAVLLALIAHGLLMVALTAGIQWNKEVPVTIVQAELWSAVPHTADAPAALETPPSDATPPLDPTPPKESVTAPPAPVPVPPAIDDAAIAVARKEARQAEEKRRLEQLKQEQALKDKTAKEQAAKLQLAQEKLAQEKLAQDKIAKEKAAKEKLAQEKLAQEKAARDKAALDKKKLADKEKTQQTQADALAKAKEAKEAKEAKMLDELRQQNMKRIAGMAGGGGNGDANANGKDMDSSGPSPGYAGRIVARIKPNIVFAITDDVVGNPRVEVEIRTSVSGNILSSRISQPSGVKAWDAAVLRAIEKTEVLPKDTNGTIPTSMTLGFRPKE